MAFSDHKITEFQNRIIELADQPNMQPDELKAYFDSSPEELRQAHNSLCDALTAPTAAANIGFAQTAGVPAGTVQAAIENVQSQVTAAIIGSIPSGSIDGDKLAQDVRDRLTAIEAAAANETNTRAGADTNLQNQINAHTSQIAERCTVITGYFDGNSQPVRLISLGRKPKAVYVCNQYGLVKNGSAYYGGLALENAPAGISEYPSVSIADKGFHVYFTSADQYNIMTNFKGVRCYYIAWV